MELSVIQKIAIWIIPLLFAITLHEVAHGWMASKLGDQTARLAGRLTINPLNHIDIIGTLILPLFLLLTGGFIFGWAKPVPVDSRNLRHPRYSIALVAIAGPAANFLMALFWAGIAKLGLNSGAWFGVPLVNMGQAGITLNLLLAILNCIPLPPLDGGRVLMSLLPKRFGYHLSRLEPYGFFILILLLVTGVLSSVITPILYIFLEIITRIFGLT